ncbi:hypothetical protein IW261DRAFT_1507363 [Armillaria novae-zelandiae]|uniref:Uncharacterized protein n=1 Tax=Armillaria novae-zelandiae TaxID=153914 RepID=A0AA39NVJ0_9AGAR|nr:hypothetical protein IW261DRAFT_1507363 [Armillaria novae-zelandiae]
MHKSFAGHVYETINTHLLYYILASTMDTSPRDISENDKNIIFHQLDLNLNRLTLQAFLHGLYTGIVTVTLWNILNSPKHLRSTFLQTIIIVLYVLATISLAMQWGFGCRAFIYHGENYSSVFDALVEFGPWWRANYIVGDVTGGISTVLVDITIIWRCWTLWNHQWKVIFIPTLCTVAGTVTKCMQIRSNLHNPLDNVSKTNIFAVDIDWTLIYILLTLAVALLCTSLIIYRIFRHAPEVTASRKIIAMLIESLAMYSLSLIIYIALESRNLKASYYADTIAAYVKAIAPTLLIGRVSAYANTISARQQMVAMWENHAPLVGCFRDEDTNNSSGCHCRDDGYQLSSGTSDKDTV